MDMNSQKRISLMKTVKAVFVAYAVIGFVFSYFLAIFVSRIGYEDVMWWYLVYAIFYFSFCATVIITVNGFSFKEITAIVLITIFVNFKIGLHIFDVEQEKDRVVTNEMIKADSDCVKSWLTQPKRIGGYDPWPQEGAIWKVGDLKKMRLICAKDAMEKEQAEELKAQVEKQRKDLLGAAASDNK